MSTLFLEFHGSKPAWPNRPAAWAISAASSAVPTSSGRPSAEERTKLWQARHDAAYSARRCATIPLWATDVCVPISRLAECILETKKDIVNSKLIALIVGHVGDGNFHLRLCPG